MLSDAKLRYHLEPGRVHQVARRFTTRDRDRILVPVPFDDLPTAYQYTLIISQAVTESVLLERFTTLGVRAAR